MEANVRWNGQATVPVVYLGIILIKRKRHWLVYRSDGMYMSSEDGCRPTAMWESYEKLFSVQFDRWLSRTFQPTLPKKQYTVE